MGRIIVIEDNIIYSDFVCRLLENKGFCCMAASKRILLYGCIQLQRRTEAVCQNAGG